MFTKNKHRYQQGFTLIETLIIVAILGIVIAIAIPSARDFYISTRLTSQTNALVSDIFVARNEAAARGLNTAICPSANGTTCSTDIADWSKGRIVFTDANRNGKKDAGDVVIKAISALPEVLSIVPTSFSTAGVDAAYTATLPLRFNPYGGLWALGTSGNLKICNSDYATGRLIQVGTDGRPSVSAVDARPACP